MKFCYQVATPDVAVATDVTAFQGNLEKSFSTLAEIGYDGVELMTLNPGKLNWEAVKKTAENNDLAIVLVCTGEIFGQLKLSFTDKAPEVRAEAVKHVKEIIDFAGFLDADINIGRVRGQYRNDVPQEITYGWAVDAFRDISDYAAKQEVNVALESITLMQTNFINTIAQAAKMVDDVGFPNFRLMMDIFHLNIEEKDMFEAIQTYSNYNMHVHLADNNRRYPGNCGFDFEKIINTFHKVGYDGAFCTEIFQIPDQERAARGAMEHLMPIFHKIYGK